MRSPCTPMGTSKRLSVALVGPGAIGKTLLKQIAGQHEYLKARLGVDVQLVGVTGSRTMSVDPAGVPITQWQQHVDSASESADLQTFSERLSALDSDTVIFDCTASDAPCDFYHTWMQAGLHVITPNKKLHSGPLERYEAVRALQAEGKAHYFYEASCGAGLPVLNTLKALREAGDEVISIEGILSGTLSYIFNTWKPGEPFSSVVLQAKELGYTEPDPREDLSGMDVARKVEDLDVSSLVPAPLKDVDVGAYLSRLPEHDEEMAGQLAAAQAAGEVLRYVGRYDAQEDVCSITLARYPADHPFAALQGTDNIVQIRTRRYDELPLIVRGPGAGLEVTAGGCFADMLQLVRYLGARG